MRWIVDKIENDIAVLENALTGEKKEISTTLLPFDIHDGSILLFENNTYQTDITEEEKRRLEIALRFQKLRSKE